MYESKYEGCLWDNYDNGYCCVISGGITVEDRYEQPANESNYEDNYVRNY